MVYLALLTPQEWKRWGFTFGSPCTGPNLK